VIAFTCPKCQQALEFKDAAADRIVRCRGCQARLRAPGQLAESGDRRPSSKKSRRVEDDEMPDVGETPEWVVPAVLLAVGLMLSVGGMAVSEGRDGFVAGLAFVAVRLLVTVPFSVIALFITAPILGVSFGPFTIAVLKLAAINVFTLGIAMTFQFGGIPAFMTYSLVAPIGWGLFKWMFQLEFSETMIVLVLTGLIQFLAQMTVATAMSRVGG
jgi:hypothetical protein